MHTIHELGIFYIFDKTIMSHKSYLYFICAVAMFGGLMFGFDVGVISGTIPFIQPYFGWDELELGWGVGSILLGAIIGAIGSGFVTDRYGRKNVMIVTALLFAASCLGMALSWTPAFFISARIIAGLAVGSASVLSPMYVAEITPPGIRGTLLAIYQMSITFGIVLAYAINYGVHENANNWRLMFGAGAIPSILFFAGLWFIPESPRWLTLKGFKEKALGVLERTGGRSYALAGMREIEESLSEAGITEGDPKPSEADAKPNSDPPFSMVLMFRPEFRRVMWVGFLLAVFVQVSGVNTVVDYAPKILMTAGVEIKNALLQTSLIGLVFFTFTIFAVWLIDKLGRRTLYIFGSSGMAVTLVLVAITFYREMDGIFTSVCIMAFIAFFASCIGPAFWTLVAEMFPNRIRGGAVAFASFTQWVFNFLVVMFFPYFLDLVGGSFTFLFLAIMSLIQLLVAIIYLKETKGKTLEEIEKLW